MTHEESATVATMTDAQREELDAAHLKIQRQDNRDWIRTGSCGTPPHDLGCCHCCCTTCQDSVGFQELVAIVTADAPSRSVARRERLTEKGQAVASTDEPVVDLHLTSAEKHQEHFADHGQCRYCSTTYSQAGRWWGHIVKEHPEVARAIADRVASERQS